MIRRGRQSVIVLALLLTLLIACKRSERDYAAKGTPHHPQYKTEPSVSLVAGSTVVEEVLPQKGSGLDGEALFKANCSACHQVSGAGIPGAFPPLDKSPYVTSDNVERLASIMTYGLQGPINVLGMTYNNVMAPLGNALKDDQLAAIATYIRGAWSNKAGAVDAKVFAAVRAKWGSRAMFSISELGEEK